MKRILNIILIAILTIIFNAIYIFVLYSFFPINLYVVLPSLLPSFIIFFILNIGLCLIIKEKNIKYLICYLITFVSTISFVTLLYIGAIFAETQINTNIWFISLIISLITMLVPVLLAEFLFIKK